MTALNEFTSLSEMNNLHEKEPVNVVMKPLLTNLRKNRK